MTKSFYTSITGRLVRKATNDSQCLRNNMADKKGEPHITIDEHFLYILHATKQEEGNYMCTVNDIKSREYFVTVVSMAKILNQGL